MSRIPNLYLLTLAQIGLRHLGYDPGPIAGLEGLRTLAAYEAWKCDALSANLEPEWMSVAQDALGVKERVGEADKPRMSLAQGLINRPQIVTDMDESKFGPTPHPILVDTECTRKITFSTIFMRSITGDADTLLRQGNLNPPAPILANNKGHRITSLLQSLLDVLRERLPKGARINYLRFLSLKDWKLA